MQHTLIPDIQRAALRRDYRIRLLIVVCFAVSVAGLIGVGALFPAFISAVNEEKSQLKIMASIRKDNDDSGIADIEAALVRDAGLVRSLSARLDEPKHSSVVGSVLNVRATVRINALSIEPNATGTLSVHIQGEASSRDALIAFKSRLEGLSAGNAVNLPLSGLTRSRDIPFSLDLVYHTSP